MDTLNIKAIRKQNKLTQQEFADIINVPLPRVNAWEQRGSNPKIKDYKAIENFLKNAKDDIEKYKIKRVENPCEKALEELKKERDYLRYTIDLQKKVIENLEKK
ncbi:MAG: helix-turn-helix domain-containing protein [Candidatus Methylacidiphilales bacterium]